MANVAVTCIKNGRSDSFGRPLVSGTYYPSVEIETAKALWNSGYVSVADASVFDQDPLAGTSPLDDFNVARALSLSRQPAQTSANLAAELAALGGYVQLSPNAAFPGNYGYGVSPCPYPLPEGFTPMQGCNDPLSSGWGGYITKDGSWMRWVPKEYRKVGNGTNGLSANAISILPGTSMSLTEANALGYYLPAEFYRGGRIQPGYFFDQFACSMGFYGGSPVAVSVPMGAPLSTNSANNPISQLGASNTYAGAFDAVRTRGNEYFPALLSAYRGLAYSSTAHAQAAQTTAVCGWYDSAGITNYVKGNNNGSLGDSSGTGVLYTAAGYSTEGLSGSGVPFNKTTHNGQGSGIADLNGNVREFASGFTSNGTNFYALSPSADIVGITNGNTLSTDHWGAEGLAANYVNLGATIGELLGSSTVKTYGSASTVFGTALSGNAWLAQCFGIPLAGGVGGTNAFGNDAMYDYRVSESASVVGGGWTTGVGAGIWFWQNNTVRTSTATDVGFRAMRYLDAGSF